MAKHEHLDYLYEDKLDNDPDSPVVVDETIAHNWQKSIAKPLESGDIHGMKEAAVISAQLQMVQLAQSAESETVRYNATSFLLSQMGHGPMTKVEHTIDYHVLPADQLISVIKSKLMKIMQQDPKFKLDGLLPKVLEVSEG
jgi:hypothetical protein